LIEECLKAKDKSSTQIITVGGIDSPGDIAKALTLGVDCVIVDQMLSNSTLLQEMQHIEECLLESISYAGGKNLDAFHDVEF
jgi:isopentenyl diphosphate isomerase/L-lactate dehydrogenase-like FMN-dependent dehydrogenase